MLRAKNGVYAVIGNRDLCCNDEETFILAMKSIGIKVLNNEVHSIYHENHLFDLIGVNDSNHIDSLSLSKNSKNISILLAHQPKSISLLERLTNTKIMLCGHTHGGQVLPFGAIMLKRQEQPYLSGLHKYKSSNIYVSSGAGHTIIPWRFLTKGEITNLVINNRISNSS